MNGDSQRILDAVVENGKNIAVLQSEIITIRKVQKTQHSENIASIKVIADHETTCSNKHAKHGNQLFIQWFLISGLILGLIGMAFATMKG